MAADFGYSFSGSTPNPITDARNELQMSGPILAKRLGLSRQYLSRAEQGTYSSLNPALRKWVANATSISPNDVDRRYRNFQKAQRQNTIERIGPHKLERNESSEPGYKIFTHWREGYWTSPLQFAVSFCVHPDSVQKYEEGIQRSMPKQILEALIEADLIELNWTDDLWRGGATERRLTAP